MEIETGGRTFIKLKWKRVLIGWISDGFTIHRGFLSVGTKPQYFLRVYHSTLGPFSSLREAKAAANTHARAALAFGPRPIQVTT